MLDNYPQVRKFLNIVVKDFHVLLKENLVGMYLTGSLTINAYEKGLSDIDVIVVLEHEIDDATFQKLEDLADKFVKEAPLTEDLDLAFVTKANIQKGFLSKNSIEFWKGELTKSENTLGDNPIVWSNILETGIVLSRIDPHNMRIQSIPYTAIHHAMKKELENLQKMMYEHFEKDIKFRYYVITTLCRILYTSKFETYTSKRNALSW